MIANAGYLVFLPDEPLKAQVIEIGRYYSKINRNWDRASVIFFIKSNNGIFVHGYGYVEFILGIQELVGLEQLYCLLNGFKQCIGFKSLNWLSRPIEITPFLTMKINVGTFHGYHLDEVTLDLLLEHIEESQL